MGAIDLAVMLQNTIEHIRSKRNVVKLLESLPE